MRNDLKLRHNDLPGEVWICPSPQQLMISFRQVSLASKEAGGILLGYRRGPHLEVLGVTMPHPNDVRGRHHFQRKDAAHQTIATAQWHESDGHIHYLGEWHTHPEPDPTPSSIDRREWKKLATIQSHPLLFIIVGTSQWYVETKGARWSTVVPG